VRRPRAWEDWPAGPTHQAPPPPQPAYAPALAADLAGRAAAFSDVELVLDPVDAVGDKLIAEWRVAATHTGLLALDEELALEPTGRRLELRGVLVAEFEGDRIRQFRQYWNEVELLDGLGLLPD
jgi:hypothetical protein